MERQLKNLHILYLASQGNHTGTVTRSPLHVFFFFELASLQLNNLGNLGTITLVVNSGNMLIWL